MHSIRNPRLHTQLVNTRRRGGRYTSQQRHCIKLRVFVVAQPVDLRGLLAHGLGCAVGVRPHPHRVEFPCARPRPKPRPRGDWNARPLPRPDGPSLRGDLFAKGLGTADPCCLLNQQSFAKCPGFPQWKHSMRLGGEGVRAGDCDFRRSCHGRGVCGVALRRPDDGCDADLGVRDHDAVLDRSREKSRPRTPRPPR